MARSDRSLSAVPMRLQLLVLMALAGLIAGCESRITPEQKAAFSRFQNMGARVNFRRGGYEVDLKNTQVTDDDLADLKKIDNLTTLDLRDTRITDAGLDNIRDIHTLLVVLLPRGTVSVEGAESLRKSLPNTTVQY